MMENENKKVMVSGIQPSGELHLGNYLGPLRHWPEMIDEFDCYFFLADLHTITVRQNPAELRKRTLALLAQYIACGLDPEKCVLFIQSHVPAHMSKNNIYFVGAGGIGMAALERYFLSRGCKVAGYDRTPSELTAALEAEGVEIAYSDDPDLIPAAFRNPVSLFNCLIKFWSFIFRKFT